VYNSAGQAIAPETVAQLPAWLETLPNDGFEFISTGFTVFREALAGTRFEYIPILTAPPALAAAIARIAYGRFVGGEASDPAALDANYVRRSDAELFWKE